MLGTAGGPPLLGFLHDEAGRYRAAYLVAGGLSALGAVLIFASGSSAPEFLITDDDLAAVASTA